MAENINPVLGNMAKDPKATEDYSKETEELIARAETMVKAGRLEEATDEILLLEKKTRIAADGISTAKLLCCIVQLHYDAKEWSKMKEYIVLLSKKRAQLKRAITDMVHLAMSWLPDLDKDHAVSCKTCLATHTSSPAPGSPHRSNELSQIVSALGASFPAEPQTFFFFGHFWGSIFFFLRVGLFWICDGFDHSVAFFLASVSFHVG